jgi:hypothetical protein
MLVRIREKGTLTHCGNVKLVQPLEISMEVHQKFKQTFLMTLPYHYWAYI